MNVGELKEELDNYGDHVTVYVEVADSEMFDIDALDYLGGVINAVVLQIQPAEQTGEEK